VGEILVVSDYKHLPGVAAPAGAEAAVRRRSN
jgi:hypothetical protein